MFITLLAQGYVEKGGGFSHYTAGLSNGGAYRRLPSATWDALQERVLTPEFDQRFADLLDKAQKAQEERRRMAKVQGFIDALASVYTEMALIESQLEPRAGDD